MTRYIVSIKPQAMSFPSLIIIAFVTLQLSGLCLTYRSFVHRPHFMHFYNFKTTRYHIVPLYFSQQDMKWDSKSAPKLDFNEDFYKVLEVSKTATPEELKKSYYKLVFRYHPDNKRSEEEKVLCNKQMMVINNAYKILKDKSLREQYDIKKKTGFYRASETSNNEQQSTDSQSNNKSKTSPKNNQQNVPKNNNNNNNIKNNNINSNTKTNESWEDTFRSYTEDYKPYTTYNNDNNDNNRDTSPESTESFGDLLQDMWTDLSMDGGKHIVQDLFDYLENNIPIVSSEGTTNNNSNEISDDEKIKIENEINLLKNTVKSLEVSFILLFFVCFLFNYIV